MLQYIIWNVNPEIVRLGGWPLKWYGLLFAAGFVLGSQIITYIFRTERKLLLDVDSLLVTLVVSTILGARLGHYLFYEPVMFLRDPLWIITPPFAGLASHGGVIGVLTGLWIYSRRKSSKATGQTFLWVTDKIAIPAALAGAFIRFGNLMNSEIVGTPTNVPWGFVFLRNHEFTQVVRHPAQLYESLSYLVLFFLLFWYWRMYRVQSAPGTLLGIALVWVFGLRFLWEFFKENQEAFEDSMSFNMGQILSVPAVLFGLFLLVRNVVRPASLIPIAMVIQSSSMCHQCDYKSALPGSGKARFDACEELISEKRLLKTGNSQNCIVKAKKPIFNLSPITS